PPERPAPISRTATAFFSSEIPGDDSFIKHAACDPRTCRAGERKQQFSQDNVVCCASGLLAFSPLFAFIAIAIKCDDGGPVFYLQRRVGMHIALDDVSTAVAIRRLCTASATAPARVSPVGGRRQQPSLIGTHRHSAKLD